MNDSKKECDNQLYEGFKKENWWARNRDSIPKVAALIYCTLVLFWSTTMDPTKLFSENPDLFKALPLLLLAGGLVLLVCLAILKYVFHDRNLKEYTAKHCTMPEQWTTNIGGVFKTYD